MGREMETHSLLSMTMTEWSQLVQCRFLQRLYCVSWELDERQSDGDGDGGDSDCGDGW